VDTETTRVVSHRSRHSCGSSGLTCTPGSPSPFPRSTVTSMTGGVEAADGAGRGQVHESTRSPRRAPSAADTTARENGKQRTPAQAGRSLRTDGSRESRGGGGRIAVSSWLEELVGLAGWQERTTTELVAPGRMAAAWTSNGRTGRMVRKHRAFRFAAEPGSTRGRTPRVEIRPRPGTVQLGGTWSVVCSSRPRTRERFASDVPQASSLVSVRSWAVTP